MSFFFLMLFVHDSYHLFRPSVNASKERARKFVEKSGHQRRYIRVWILYVVCFVHGGFDVLVGFLRLVLSLHVFLLFFFLDIIKSLRQSRRLTYEFLLSHRQRCLCSSAHTSIHDTRNLSGTRPRPNRKQRAHRKDRTIPLHIVSTIFPSLPSTIPQTHPV